VLPNEICQEKFLYFLLKYIKPCFIKIARNKQTTGLGHVTKADLQRITVRVPKSSIQSYITSILQSFDDKIELLRRQNKTLESIAQTIFKEWFVKFKVNGKKLKIDSKTNLPEGWRMGKLGEIADIIDCLHSKKPERREHGLPLLQVWNICDDGLLDMQDTFYISEQDYKQWISRMEASPGDCAITNVGRVGAVARIPVGFKAALGRNMTGIRCKPSFPYPTFLIECLLSKEMRNEILAKSDAGTILDALNVRNIPKLQFNLATKSVMDAFEEIACPLRSKIEMNNSQIQTLSKLRDTLLPKLMKGEIRVRSEKGKVKSEK
jgi:type I restriction enzyme S subunit